METFHIYLIFYGIVPSVQQNLLGSF